METTIKIFKALSDEARLRIFLLFIHSEELCVCELVNILKIEQSRISHSIRILREAGLIVSRREGRWIIYSINPAMKNNEIIHGLKKEVKSPEQDLKNFAECNKKNIREKCKCN